MAAKVSRDKLWVNALCPICAKYFTDPVSLKCGHNFCRSCITRCWEELSVGFICPRWCKYFLQERKYEPNRELANFVEATKQLVERMKEEAKGWGICGEHQLPLNFFCEDDQADLCSRCCYALGPHGKHNVVEVCRDVKRQCSAYMDILFIMGDELTIYLSNFDKVSQEWQKRLEADRKKTIATFKNLRLFLDEQERVRLAKMIDLEKEIIKKKDEYEKEVSNQVSLLNSIYQEMTEKYCDDRKFLQDFGNALYSFDHKQPENPVLIPIDWKDKMQKFCDRKLFLEGVLKEFNDEMAALLKGRRRKRTRTDLAMEEKGTRVDVTLDPDTASDYSVISADQKRMCYYEFFRVVSEDQKRMCFDECYRVLPKSPKTFLFTPCVLGCQAFSAGRHWWEVKVVGNGYGWAVGVARETLDRKKHLNIWGDVGLWREGAWFVGKESNGPVSPRRLLAFSPPQSTLLILSRKPEKIQVCLDYPGGQVAFFNADTDELIYVFRSCSFLGKKVHPFFWVFGLSVYVSC